MKFIDYSMAKERILGFDLARVVAIIVVIGIYHNLGYTGLYHTNPAVRVLVYSSLGLFTFLSAFLLASRYSFAEKTEIQSFYKKRVLRVWPLFVISSLMLAVLGFNAWMPTIKGIVGISPFWAPHPTTMWYVAMLISLYIITPFVVRGGVKLQCLKAVAVMTVVGSLQIVFGTVVPRTFNYFTVYLLGLLLGRNYYEPTMRFLRSKKTLIISIFWTALVVVVFFTKNAYLKSFSSVVGIIALLSLSLLIAEKLHANQFLAKSITALSYASFCAYLFHREIIWVLFRLYKPKGALPIFLEVLIVAVPLSFLCAYYIQKVYDWIIGKLTKEYVAKK